MEEDGEGFGWGEDSDPEQPDRKRVLFELRHYQQVQYGYVSAKVPARRVPLLYS